MADLNPTGLCQCGCGRPAPIAKQTKKKYGHVRGEPCRFIRGHAHRSHSMTKSPTYRSWRGMLARCTNQADAAHWKSYGARGITVCESWRESFENFLADMGERPEGKTLDRVDNDLGYSKENCRWASYSEQANNTRRSHVVTAFGESMTVTEWAAKLGVPAFVIWNRVTYGWPHEEAISTPVRAARKKR